MLNRAEHRGLRQPAAAFASQPAGVCGPGHPALRSPRNPGLIADGDVHGSGLPSESGSRLPQSKALRALLLALSLVPFSLAAASDFPAYDGTKERDAFWSLYNQRVLTKLQTDAKDLPTQIAKATDPAEKADLEKQLAKITERLKKPEYFTFAKPSDLPTDLVWQDGMTEPEIGDPLAKKGGTMRDSIPSFPATVRVLGENANGSFRGNHYDDNETKLVELHPDTGKIIPGLANQWAVTPDRRTVFYRIDPDARWSDGEPIVSDDILQQFYMQLSEYPKNPFGNQAYGETFTNITRYDEHTLSITLTDAKPLPEYDTTMPAMSRRFYGEFGPDFEQRYQWRGRPSAGAYIIREEDINFGRSITMTRVKNWWARDKKFYRHRFNVDRIIFRVIRLNEKSFELFRQGELDAFWLLMSAPDYWYDKMEIPEAHKGYIHKAKFYNVWPSSMGGMWLNTTMPPLDNKEVRLGLCFATNYQKVIDFDLRGDFSRINSISEGYPLLGNAPITARPFDPKLAREHFAKAGYTTPDRDGVLKNAKGERLSVTITHRKNEIVQKVMQRLKEEALRCGLEYKLEGMDTTAYFQKATQKKHMATSVAYSMNPPFPDHYQSWYSKEGRLADGKTAKPNTNNLTCFADPRMDKLCDAERAATTVEEFRAAAHAADQIIHDEAAWIAGYDQNYWRIAYWRWVKFPAGVFNVAASEYPLSPHVHWIDEDVQRETLEAMQSGKTFPETELVFDQHLKSHEK